MRTRTGAWLQHGEAQISELWQFGIRCGRGSVCGSFGKSCQCYSYMLLPLTACVACTPAYEMVQGHEAWMEDGHPP